MNAHCYVLSLLVVLSSAACHSAPRQPPSDRRAPEATQPPLSGTLTGVWQDVSDMPSGWSDAYQFFPDGRFIFNHSQMDCAKREVSYEGTFTSDQRELTLTITLRHVLEGGHFEQSFGSCGSDSTLEGATDRAIVVIPPTVQVLAFRPPAQVSVPYVGEPDRSRPMWRITVGDRAFWKFDDDPDSYR